MTFRNRAEAGRVLAERLEAYATRPNLLVLGLPRGGVPVAFEVARALQAPLDVFLVHKLGVPGQRELALGAIASGGIRVLNEEVVAAIGIEEEAIARAAASAQAELERREGLYRGERPRVELARRTVILVDDGLATGATMRAAALGARAQDPEQVVVAVPVAAEATLKKFGPEVDELICVQTPEPFRAVGAWYDEFLPITDEDVRELLARAAREAGVAGQG
jgi:putative phosphoribosyl transferase